LRGRSDLLRWAKFRVKSWRYRAHVALVRRFRSYDAKALLDALRRAGIQEGDQLMLHASFDDRYGFRGSAVDAVDVFQAAVGSTGTLYMVSLPYTSSTLEYLRADPLFDPKRTPSRMGLLSEIFRRRPGVLRSCHPTHPVLGLGPAAESVLSGHELCAYPCGPGSPFERLLHAGAKVAFFNVSLSNLTYFHYLEHLVAPQLPFPIYSAQPVPARLVMANGDVRSIPVYTFTPECIRRRRPEWLQKWMRDEGLVDYRRLGASELTVIGLRSVTDLALAHAARGNLFFDISPARA
jgi:aminoglycoside 3-N-acetyltransferase